MGDGFSRVMEYYDAVTTHIIRFDEMENQPSRQLTAMFFRDKLYVMTDRRDGLTAEQEAAWFDEMVDRYGSGFAVVSPSAKWRWQSTGGIEVTYARDNASENYMSAYLMIEHVPTSLAAHAYLVARETRDTGSSRR
jgi:hypothetical protein